MSVNIFSLLVKYAADRQQTENQFTLSFVSVLEYYPDYLEYFTAHCLHLVKRQNIELIELVVEPHPRLNVKINGKRKIWCPDILIENKGGNVLVIEIKVKHRQIAKHQKLYGKKAKCPLIFLTEHKFLSQKKSVVNITWNDIGKLSDDFLSNKRDNLKYKFLEEFIKFLKEKKMYHPNTVVTHKNIEYLTKFVSEGKPGKGFARGLQESFDVLQWMYAFLESRYEDIISKYKCLNKFNYATRYWQNKYYGEKRKKEKFISLCLFGHLCRDKNNEWIGIQFGWEYNDEKKDWCYYTSMEMRSLKENLLDKYIISKNPNDPINYREKKYFKSEWFKKIKQRELIKCIPIWEKETEKLAKKFVNSKLFKRANRY